MLRNMRTSIDFSESVLSDARKVSKSEGVTLKQLAEEGLRMAIAKREQAGSSKFRMVTFGDETDEKVDLSWEDIREHVYPARQ